MSEHQPIDALEKKIRLGCGLIAGLVVGLFVGFLSLNLVAGRLFVFAIALAVLFGVLAVRYGDRFWMWILRYR
jgi:uncharacterized membrane protein YccC